MCHCGVAWRVRVCGVCAVCTVYVCFWYKRSSCGGVCICVLGDRVSVHWCVGCVCGRLCLCLFNKNRNLVSCVRKACLILIYSAHFTRMKEGKACMIVIFRAKEQQSHNIA